MMKPQDQSERPVMAITGTGDDMDLAWAWITGTLGCLLQVPDRAAGAAALDRQLRAAPALAVLLSYRRHVVRAQALGEQ